MVEKQTEPDDWLDRESKGDEQLRDLLDAREAIGRLITKPEDFSVEEQEDLRKSLGVVAGKIMKRKHILGIDPVEEP